MPEKDLWKAERNRTEAYLGLGDGAKALENLDDVLLKQPFNQELIDWRRKIVKQYGIKEAPIKGLLLGPDDKKAD